MLRRRAARQHGREGRPLDQQQVGGVVAHAPQLLDGEAAGEHAARAAIALRERQREQAEIAERGEHVMRIGGVAVDLRRARRNPVAGEGAHRVAEQTLFPAEAEVLREHYPPPYSAAAASGGAAPISTPVSCALRRGSTFSAKRRWFSRAMS